MSFEVDLDHPPPLSEQDKALLVKLAERSEEDIDLSDAPYLGDEAWETAVRGRFYGGKRAITAVPVSADILAWFCKPGDDHELRINEVLRKTMNEERQAAQEAHATHRRSA